MEKELKFGLSKKSYDILFTLADTSAAKVQENTYFDTKDQSLRRLGAGLRVRVENSQSAFLTLKKDVAHTKQSARLGRHEREEWETKVTLKQAVLFSQKPNRLANSKGPLGSKLRSLLSVHELSQLKRVGTLHTLRVPLKIGRFCAELDLWTVHGRIFYELELEAKDLGLAEKALAQFLKKLKISARPRRTTKLAALFKKNKKKTPDSRVRKSGAGKT